MTRPERFWAKVHKTDLCWFWRGATNGQGYGHFTWREDGRCVTRRAHRYAYELLVGPIPKGVTLDHLCRNRLCVNPDHLEPVSNRESILRGEGVGVRNAAKTHCKRGHEFTAENTYSQPSRPHERLCRQCQRRKEQKRGPRVRHRSSPPVTQTSQPGGREDGC